MHTRYFYLTIEVKDYNVMIDGRDFFWSPRKNYLRTFANEIQKLSIVQWDDYTTGWLLDYPYSRNTLRW